MIEYSPEWDAFRNIKDKMKPTICASCRNDDGRRSNTYGHCAKCLENQAYNTDLVETSLFIMDKYPREYHDGGVHDVFKSTPLRMPGEHPYLYYGIEIEVEFNSDYVDVFEDYDGAFTDKIKTILDEFSNITEGMFVYERDGSLENGVEFISRPTSYPKWVDKGTVEKMKNGFQFLINNGAYIKQPDSNGLHIHISRKFFDYGKTGRNNRDEAYQDMDWLFQFFQKELEALGGRNYTSYCASKVDKIKERYGIGRRQNDDEFNAEFTVKGKLKKGGRIPRGDHYSAVNMSGPTIEARIFNSTVDYKRVLSYIEIMRNFAHAVRDGEIEGKTLNQILNTKDNLYLDGLVREVRNELYKSGRRLTLTRKNKDEIVF